MRKTLFFICLLFNVAAIATDFVCNDTVKKNYVKGNYNSGNARDKIFKFKNLRDDLILEIDNGLPNGEKAGCLMDFYDKSMKESAEFWGQRQSEASCTETCQIEYAKSTKYLENLDGELRQKIRERLPAAEKALAENNKNREACSVRDTDPAGDLLNLKNSMCCGSSSEKGEIGAVRAIYPEITHKSCLIKTQPSTNEMLSVGGLVDCVSNLVQQALKTVWHNIKSLVSLPGELWAAKDQIWQLMTNSDARKAFASRFIGSVKSFIQTRSEALGSCLNQYEQSQYICRVTGEIISHVATPLAMAKVLKAVANGATAGNSFIGEALTQSARGKEMLSSLNKAKEAGQSAMTAAKSAKSAAIEASRKSVKAAGELSKKSLTKLSTFSKAKETFKDRLDDVIEKYGGRKPASQSVIEPTSTVRGESPDAATKAKVEAQSKADLDRDNSLTAQITAGQSQEAIESANFLGKNRSEFLSTVKKYKIQPTESVQVGDAKISLSEPFDIGNGRIAAIAVIENAGVATTHVYYRSNSQGIFRLLPGTAENGWFSKGITESSLSAPSEVQKALSAKVTSGQIRQDVPKDVYRQAVPTYETKYESMKAAFEDPTLNVKRRQVLNTAPETEQSRSSSHVKPENLKLVDPKSAPNFSSGAISSYETSTGGAGKVEAKVFRSENGELEYTFFEDKSGRAWIASIDNVRAPINSAGIRSTSVDSGDLTMPRFEYHEQIPNGYARKGRFGDRGEYGDAWPYLKQNPLIQEYYRKRGLEVPE